MNSEINGIYDLIRGENKLNADRHAEVIKSHSEIKERIIKLEERYRCKGGEEIKRQLEDHIKEQINVDKIESLKSWGKDLIKMAIVAISAALGVNYYK